MELNKRMILVVPLIFCSLLSGIGAVPSDRLEPWGEPPSAAPAPSTSDAQVPDLHAMRKAQLEALCSDADSPSLCVSTIAPFIHGALDPVVAAKVEMGATMNITVKICETIKSLQAEADSSGDDKASLDICADQYSSIVDTINDCYDSIKQNDVYGAWVKISSVLSYQEACKDAFREGGSPLPFAEDAKTLFLLTGNCLAILMRLSGVTLPY